MKMPSPMWFDVAGAGRQIGLAEPPEKMRRKSGAVIGDLDRDRRPVPVGRDADLVAGELHRVLDQVVEPVHDLRAAPDQRLVGGGRAGRREDQPDPRIAVWRARRLDQRRDRQPRIGRGAALLVGVMRQLREDVAAPLRLAQQQLGILGDAANRAAGRAPAPWRRPRSSRAGCRARAPPRRPARRPPRRAARAPARAGSRRPRRAAAAPPARRSRCSRR